MIYSYKDLLKKYGSRYNVEKALKKHEINKIDKNIYSEKLIVDPLVLYSKKYPSAIITMDSAFFYYDLTDVIPNKTYLATPKNYRTINNDKIVQLFMNKEILEIGKITLNIDENVIHIYDKERLLIELIRKRKQIPFDYYKEIIANYRDIVDELDMYKIETYLPHFKREKDIANTLMREVF